VPAVPLTFGFITVQNFSLYTTEIYNAGSGVKEVTKVDSEIVRFNLSGFQDVIMIFSLCPAKEKLSPAKLIDVKSSTVVQQVPMWDPARGHHAHVAIHNVDLQLAGDPARYEFTPNPNSPNSNPENFWNQQEVGTVWLDTAELGYLSYYDDKIYTDVNERLYNWGKLAPWADVKVYQWTRSTVPPDQWDATVVSQQNNTSIAQNNKATGTPRKAVFKRVRTTYPVTANVGTDQITSGLHAFVAGDRVLFTATGSLPGGIEAGIKYTVETSGIVFRVIDPSTEAFVDITSAGSGVQIIPAFVATDWNAQTLIRDRTYAPFALYDINAAGPDVPVTTAIWPQAMPTFTGDTRLYWTPQDFGAWVTTGAGADTVDVYVNGELLEAGVFVVDASPQLYVTLGSALTLNEYDIIDIVRPVHTITTADTAFDPDVEDDGTQMIQWKADYEYSSTTTTFGGTNVGTTTTTYYYFWVQDSINRDLSDSSSLSALEVKRQLITIPTPYFVVQRPKDDPYLVEKYGYGMIEYGSIFSLGILTEADYQIPVLYREAIIRKVASYINDDDRYIIRFTRDWALRDDLEANGHQMNLKEKHQEWFMFRREQTNTIPRELWNRMVESLIGYKLDNPGTRVPSLEHELYDSIFGSDTRFGLGNDQAFVDKTLGLNTVLSYLQSPANDFSPTDIDAFFAAQSFDTPAGIAQAMDVIYNTFNSAHVNSIWFETLLDALSTRSKYKELMKTSWIALHGIRVLEVGGLFDD
jgi:hypothetical protein